MKYRAICPHCGVKFSRRMSILNTQKFKRECSECGKAFRPVFLTEYLGNIIFGLALAVPFILADYRIITWLSAIVAAAVIIGLMIFLWPYLTSFKVVNTTKNDEA